LGENIPKAIATLKDFWLNTLLPAIRQVWSWIKGTLIPFFKNTLIPFLETNITKALSTLGDFWENTLLPAIENVWQWLDTTLIPFIRDQLIPFLETNVPKAIETLSDFWTNTLLPALNDVWAFLNEDVIPLFQALWDLFNVAGALAIEALAGLWENILLPAMEQLGRFVNENFGPLWEWLSDTLLPKATSGFEGIKNAIQFVIDKIKLLTDRLEDVQLPAALTPGSPTPFEIGLLGINKALGEFNQLLDDNALIGAPNMSLNPTVNPALAAMDAQAGNQISYSSETTIHTNQNPMRVLRASRHLDKLGEAP